jgi:ABC-type branched-subunit amino acid transport system substrate-binding protein
VPKPTPTFCAAVKTLSNLHSLNGVKAVIGTSASSHRLFAADIAALVRAGRATPSSPAAQVARSLASSLESAHSYEVKFSTASLFNKAVDGTKVAFYDTKAAAYGVDLYVYYRACS